MNTSDIDPRDERLSDPAFERLSAGDPAATAEPDSSVIRAKVDSAIDAATTPVVDLAAQRQSRRPARWLQIAAAAAGVVAVGGGAFFAGQQSADAPITAGSSSTADAPAAPLDGTAPASGAAGSFAAPGAQNESRSAAMDMIGGGPFGRTVFASEGLSGATASAQAWGYDPAAVFSAETASRLAAALGVEGEPVLNYGSWHVGSLDWTGASVDLSSDGLTSFYFNNPAVAPWLENSTTTGASAEDATAAVTDLMVTFGLDPAAFAIAVDTEQDPRSTSVVATPLLAGDGNGTWYANVTTGGLANLNGSLAPLVDLGSYDVVSPQTAVERLGDARFGASQQASPFAAGDLARGVDTLEMAPGDMTAFAPDDPAAVPTLPGTAVPGAGIAWPVANVTITGATLGTSTYFQPDGSVALLPTYTLTGSDGSVWTVLAVADAHLDFAAAS